MNIMVVDSQGGGLGKQLVSTIKKKYPQLHIQAVGTNVLATSAMLKAGADEAATGENSIAAVSRKADIIIGPVGMVIADSMLGEITPRMAAAIAQSSARRIMIPFNNCDNYIAGVTSLSTGQLIEDAMKKLEEYLGRLPHAQK